MMKRILWILLAAITFVACSDNDSESVSSTVDTKGWTLDTLMDTTYAPGDNYFMYCNGTWYKNAVIPSGSYSVGTSIDQNQFIIDFINKQVPSDPIFVKLYNDVKHLEEYKDASIAAVSAKIHQLDKISTKEEAWKAMALAVRDGFAPIVGMNGFTKGGILRGVLICPKSRQFCDSYDWTSYCLTAAGYKADEVSKIIAGATEAEKQVAATNTYQDVILDSLEHHPEIISGFIPSATLSTGTSGAEMISAYCSALNIDKANMYVNSSAQNYFQAVQSLTAEQIKDILQISIAKSTMKYTSQDAIDNYNKASGNNFTTDDINNELGNTFIEGKMRYYFSKMFSTATVTDERKAEITQLANELKDALKEKIEKITWMSDATKVEAQKKLKTLNIVAGRPDTWDEEAIPTINGKSLGEDYLNILRAEASLLYRVIGKSIQDKDAMFEYLISQHYTLTIPNANYDRFINTAFLYPVFMNKPVYDPTMSDAFNYASLCAIGHEITHGFDDQGSDCNYLGDVEDWWTAADKAEFKRRQQILIDCYNKLEISFGNDSFKEWYDNGKRTLSENISDIGGLHIAFAAYQKRLAKDGYSGEELKKQGKKFFQAFANLWREKSTASALENQYYTDEHSPAKERINGSVMNTDEWYDLYQVTPTNKLYLDVSKRANIW